MSRVDETLLDLSLSRSTVQRSAALRGDATVVAAALGQPSTRILRLRDGRAPVRAGERPALELRAPEPGDLDRELWFLGVQDGVTYLAVDEPAAQVEGEPGAHDEDAGVDGTSWLSLRQVGADVDDTDAGLLTTATALGEWHHRHGHCPRCGAPTEVVQGGWVRRCPQDGSEHYPRTDPAVIMAVVDADDRLLLGSGVAWPADRVSVLAGFVEAGESLESAVVREVKEEVGLDVGDLVYRGNQPWPFPASLMLGFRASTPLSAPDLVVDPVELSSARWHTREELGEAVADGRLTLPPRVSIARRLIEEWFGGPIAGPGSR